MSTINTDQVTLPTQSITGGTKTGWKNMQEHPWVCAMALIVLLLSVVYYPSFFSPTFIVHEDSILQNSLISNAHNIPTIFSKDFLIFSSGQYLPVGYAVLALVRTFVPADNLLFWHGWLLLFHAVNTLLVFALLRRFTKRLILSLMAAVVFCVHPLATVLVNDINQFSFLLGSMFNLGTLLAYISFAREGKKQNYLISLLLYCVALFTVRQTLSLGLILLCFELLQERTRFKTALIRILPFAVIPFLLSPLLFMSSPHPLYYKYIPAGSFWYGFYSVTGATGTIMNGLTLALPLPVVLHDTVERIFSWSNPKFLLWIMFNCSMVIIAVWAMIRRQWHAFGLLMMYLALLPYSSVAINQVENYISWIYFYFPLAGFAFLVAGLADQFGALNNRYLKLCMPVSLAVILLFWCGKTVQLNILDKTPDTYWDHVYAKGAASKTISQTALNKRGKAMLRRDNLSGALECFFSPANKDYKAGCLALSRYYCQHKEYLASAMHFRFGAGAKESGLVLQEKLETGAMLLTAAGALDYAEDQVGQIIMANPYHTEAMAELADIWRQKGNVQEAKRILNQIKKINPIDIYANRMQQKLDQFEKDVRLGNAIVPVSQPSSDWIDYAIQHKRPPEIRQQIIELSRRADPRDAVIQLEAMVSLFEDGKIEEAADKTPAVFKELNNSSIACSAVCEVLTRIGNINDAIKAGSRAVQLDKTSQTAWRKLTEAYSLKENVDEKDSSFIDTIGKNPVLASSFYYNLGLQKSKAGNDAEAVALFEKAMKAQPAKVEIYKALAKSAAAVQNPSRAVEILNSSLKIKRDDPSVYMNLAVNYMQLNLWEQAIQAFYTAIKLDPENHLFHYNLALALKRLNRLEEAVVEFRRTAELKPDYLDAVYKLGYCLMLTKKTDEALVQYKKIIVLNPDFPNIHSNIGTIYMVRHDFEQAISEFEEDIRHNPKSPIPYQYMMQVYYQRKELDHLKSTLERAQKSGAALDAKLVQKIKAAIGE